MFEKLFGSRSPLPRGRKKQHQSVQWHQRFEQLPRLHHGPTAALPLPRGRVQQQRSLLPGDLDRIDPHRLPRLAGGARLGPIRPVLVSTFVPWPKQNGFTPIPGGAPRRAQPLSAPSRLASWPGSVFVHAKAKNNNGNNTAAKRQKTKSSCWANTQHQGVLSSQGLYPGIVQTTISVWYRHASLYLCMCHNLKNKMAYGFQNALVLKTNSKNANLKLGHSTIENSGSGTVCWPGRMQRQTSGNF